MNAGQRREAPRLGAPDALALAALALLVLAFLWKMAFTQLIPPRGDAFTYFYPYWQARSAALRAGRLPLWNPDLFMGAPFLANSQAGVLYPPNWALIWLDAPNAFKAAAVGHTIWAAAGAYLFARRSLHASVLGATLAGAVFALGGYFTAQVEHINQLQGLAWLPWLFWLWDESVGGSRRAVALVGGGFAMQVLAGHTQTAFISGVGLGVWALWHTVGLWRTGERHWQSLAWPLGSLALAVTVAVGLAAAQILPSLELASYSPRSGGLPLTEAISFSLHPALAGRALLPGYASGSLFPEYVAGVGVAGLALAVAGLWLGRGRRRVLGLGLLAGLGLFFALGAYNPVYWALVAFVPGFDLFRAPARWLALYSLGSAGLAGVGLTMLTARTAAPQPRWLLPSAAALILALVGLSFLAPLAVSDISAVTAPLPAEIIGWLAALALTLGGVWWLLARGGGSVVPSSLAALAVVELFIAGQNLPYNRLSAPQAWSSLRPSVSTLLAETHRQQPPSRFLSLSDIFFDPGDLRELQALYEPYLTDRAVLDLVIATKLKEVLSPNLSMAWGLPSMDGFDGGLLPTRDTVRYSSLLLGDERAVDGRLREYLDAVPPVEWLRLANVRYIITDKVADAWLEGVYYDLTFPMPLARTGAVEAHPAQPFVATGVQMILSGESLGALPAGVVVAELAVVPPGGESRLTLPLEVGDARPLGEERHLLIIALPEPTVVEHVEITPAAATGAAPTILGVSLVDSRTGVFLPTTLSGDGAVRLIHSGDVKIYEDRGALPRAYLVCAPARAGTVDEAFERLAADPGSHVVVVDDLQPSAPVTCDASAPGRAVITRYEPERVEIAVDVAGQGVYLILSDAWYPGWQVAIDGGPAGAPLRANGIFRAVAAPPGSHVVVLTYESAPLRSGGIISATTALALMVGLLPWRRWLHLGAASGEKARV